MTKITRGNPYTHEEHTRESVQGMYCCWCGQSPRVLFKYDGTKGIFCNLSCWRSYHS